MRTLLRHIRNKQTSLAKNSPRYSLLLSEFKRLFRFGLAGFLNTVFSYALFALFVYSGVVYWVAVIFCYIIGLIFNYKSIEKIAFYDSDKKSFKRFVVVFVGQCGANILFVSILLSTGVSEYIAAWIVAIPMAVSGYILNKKYVFLKI